MAKPEILALPTWLVNRRRDYETGKDMHLLQSDLNLANESDVKRLQKIRSRRGVRHALHLPLRGQRTKANFRRNKGRGSLGVQRKKEAAKKGGKDSKK